MYPRWPYHECKGYGQGQLCCIQDAQGKIHCISAAMTFRTGEDKSLYDIVWKKLIDISDLLE